MLHLMLAPQPNVIRMLPSPMQPTPLLVTKHSPADGSAPVFLFFFALLSCSPIHTLGLNSLLLYRLDAMPLSLQVLLP